MLKRLKRKFLKISMISVVLVLFIIMGTINLFNYINTTKDAEQLLNFLEENNGSFTEKKPEKTPPEKKETENVPPLSPETPFNTRYFTVTLMERDGKTEVLSTNMRNIAAITSEDAISYANSLYQKEKCSGYLKNYRYRQIIQKDQSIMYVFIDCEKELRSFSDFLFASILISLCGLLLIFILLTIFSGHAVRPILESYEKQKRFITDASHEIKTPLAVIRANTEVIEMENGTSQWTQSTQKQIERLTALTEKLVFLSRMEEEQPNLPLTPLSATDILTEVVESFDAVCVTQKLTTTISIEPDIFLLGNPDSLRRLFTLLIDNAIKYSTKNLRICATKKKNTAIFLFENSVDTIQTGRHPELFERFYRPDHSRSSETGGFGIGLSTAKAITEAHKGKIIAKSPNSHSIRFIVTLPLKKNLRTIPKNTKC